MATVYKAYDTRLEADVAVKVIRTDKILPAQMERSLKRFEREAKSLAKLTHSNIVKVQDFGDYNGSPFLVMPYLPGGTLKQKLNNKPMPYQEAARLLIPIARALAFSHRQGLIHRDVKPANILITESGDPMLSDFGIAKIMDDEATMDLTGTSSTVGTPEYMAPEQITSKTVDHRADIYSFGIVFYEMVTGRKPFQADTPMAVLFKHASEPLPRPRKFIDGLPDSVEKILVKALAKQPENRYADMDEFASALESLLGNARYAPKEKISGKENSRPKPPTPSLFSGFVKSIKNIPHSISDGSKSFASGIGKNLRLILVIGVLVIVVGAVGWLSVFLANSPASGVYFTRLYASQFEIHYLLGGEDMTILSAVKSRSNWHPAPDNLGNLYYVSTLASGQVEIYVMDKSGIRSQVTHTENQYSSWAPAPDGKGNIYFSSDEDGGKVEVFVIDKNGKRSQVTHTDGNSESWAPAPDGDGNLYFVSNQDGNPEVYVIYSKGVKKQVTHTSSENANWSPAPDGDGNLYFVSNRDGEADIFVIDAKGKLFQATKGQGKYSSWSPVPDGKGNLYFTTDRNQKIEVFLMDPKGQIQRLSDIPSGSWLKQRSSDGSVPGNVK